MQTFFKKQIEKTVNKVEPTLTEKAQSFVGDGIKNYFFPKKDKENTGSFHMPLFFAIMVFVFLVFCLMMIFERFPNVVKMFSSKNTNNSESNVKKKHWKKVIAPETHTTINGVSSRKIGSVIEKTVSVTNENAPQLSNTNPLGIKNEENENAVV